MEKESCIICKEPFTGGRPFNVLSQKGCDRLHQASKERGDDIQCVPGQHVHSSCRLDYTSTRRIAQGKKKAELAATKTDTCVLRSDVPQFDFKKHCLFCGQIAKFNGKKRGQDVFPVRTFDFQTTVAKICDDRKDGWSETVSGRLAFVQDLPAADAIYHQACNVNFRTGKQIPQKHSNESTLRKRLKPGRPEDSLKHDALLKAAQFLEENDDEQVTLGDLDDKMKEFLSNTGIQPYTNKQTKAKLKDIFGDSLIFTEINGKPNVVTFRKTAESILFEFYKEPTKDNSDDENLRFIETAANLVKNEIRATNVSSKFYPNRDQMSTTHEGINFLPPLLMTFLKVLFVGKDIDVKLASIGQAIMQATRPKILLAPLQLGLGIEMHHQFGSRFLIDSLHKHGFACSYSEVQKYERSAAVSHGIDLPKQNSEQLMQHVADNVDHNICTLDGFGTFHGMGIITTITPGKIKGKSIPRVNVTADDIRKVGTINIKYYKPHSSDLEKLTYRKLTDLEIVDKTIKADLLWKTSLILHSPRPAWSGMMQPIHSGEIPGESAIVFMPMIDMDPTDMSCIYSTLSFISQQAKKCEATPIVTFDQPLWWKAVSIIHSEPMGSELKSMVVRLGGLHLQMSFLGCIGHLMAGSGLQELLEKVYAKNTIKHMMSGKAISRAIRGHFLVDAALNILLIANAYNVPLPQINEPYQRSQEKEEEEEKEEEVEEEEEEEEEEEICAKEEDDTEEEEEKQSNDLSEIRQLLNEVIDGEKTIDDILASHAVDAISKKIHEQKMSMKDQRTAMLWIQYMDMVDILKQFIKAERTGNWLLHLKAVQNMLPFFAAAGHYHYTKSAYLYLQMMEQLKDQHPEVYSKFMNGYHVIRRSNRYWAGLSTDLVIEQALMRSLKTNGGLTRGRGMTEMQRLVWVMSMPACADVTQAMQEFTGTMFVTSEQHKDIGSTRQSRDFKDTCILLQTLKNWNPFAPYASLCSISSNILATASVNVDQAQDVGIRILDAMKGESVYSYKLRRKDKAITLACQQSISVGGETVQVDPQLLFQRLTVFALDNHEDPKSAFQYELCSYPPALFDSSAMPRQANKSVLAKTMWEIYEKNHCTDDQSQKLGDKFINLNRVYVLDGGALLQRVPWERGIDFQSICQLYIKYIGKRYQNATIVFDGYDDGPSIKDATHQRRTGYRNGPTVNFTARTINNLKKDEILANKTNKQRFINLLSDSLVAEGYKTVHAKNDADVLIVQTAVESAKTSETVVVGDDTDLLVLLCFHADVAAHNLFLIPEPKKASTKQRTWNIRSAKSIFGPDTCSRLLFIHAILGCDTTSQLFGIGKGVALKMAMNNIGFATVADEFSREGLSKDNIVHLGEKALVALYHGSENEGLDNLRYRRFCEKVVSSSKCVQPQTLPPTSASSRYHSLRVYFQIQEWMGKSGSMNPVNYGWKTTGDLLLPIMTDVEPAPKELLEIVHCNCKSGCSTRRCSCQAHGLECTKACRQCKGEICTNAPKPYLDLEDEL